MKTAFYWFGRVTGYLATMVAMLLVVGTVSTAGAFVVEWGNWQQARHTAASTCITLMVLTAMGCLCGSILKLWNTFK